MSVIFFVLAMSRLFWKVIKKIKGAWCFTRSTLGQIINLAEQEMAFDFKW